MNPQQRDELIDALIEGDISEADFLRLEAEFSVDPSARQDYYDRLRLSALLEAEAAQDSSSNSPVSIPLSNSGEGAKKSGQGNVLSPMWSWRPAWIGIAAAVLVLVGVVALWFRGEQPTGTPVTQAPLEQKASGFAVLASQAGAVWKGASLADGALIPAGKLQLLSGVAQLELFSGVTAVIEGEAEFEILSAMEMSVTRGKIRAHVPEPAQGFRIRTAEGEVVDLGTEFALNVSPTHSEVHVLDGDVEWHPRAEAMRRMAKGQALRWGADGKGATLPANGAGFVGMAELSEKLVSSRQASRENWQRFSATLRRDPRLVAYYRMGAAETWNRRLPNEAVNGAATVHEGAIVAAARVADRWGMAGSALDFSPTGSRVRLNVPGEYRSLTLLCWVKINSLDRWYNSLFLTDGHELHEPHWQIMDDGRLFFSVKKNDTWDPKKGEKDKHIFYSAPFWNASMSGQWLMLATTYDVEARTVTHYLNGQQLSQEAIPAEYLVETVRIGAASLCNWGLPERDDSRFAVRNLNGSMDEFALFSAALTAKEITELYEQGKP
jgi:Concanavalin A-like lectin/glucanases superfamily/FecR protein